MLFLSDEILDNKAPLFDKIEKEKAYINSIKQSQQKLKDILIDYMQKIADYTNNEIDVNNVDSILEFLDNLKKSLELSNQNLTLLSTLLKFYDKIFMELNTTFDIKDLKTMFKDMDIQYSETIGTVAKNTLYINNFLYSTLSFFKLSFTNSLNNSNNEKTNIVLDRIHIDNSVSSQMISENNKAFNNNYAQKDEIVISSDNSSPNNTIVENTLIISETKGYIFLPYSIDELNETLKKYPEKYSSIENIIEENYTLSFNLFKNPAIARFREAYKLMRDKENASIRSAFDLGMELLFNYNLHPAIIAACRNLDELDIYLDYLENNEIDKFDCFKIIFDIAPIVVKQKK